MSNVQEKASEMFDFTSLHFEFERVKIMSEKMNSLVLSSNHTKKETPITDPQIIESTIVSLTQELTFTQKIYAK